MSKIIINSEELSNIFQEKCKNYNHIAFVTAWAGNPNEKSIQCLYNNRYKITKAVVGLHFYQTSPFFIKKFWGISAVRYITNRNTDIFHPKVYLFYNNKNEWEALVGSSNLTMGGFEKNTECNVLLTSDEDYQNVYSDLLIFISNQHRESVIMSEDEYLVYCEYSKKNNKNKTFDNLIAPLNHNLTGFDWDIYYSRLIDNEGRNHKEKIKIRLKLLDRCQLLFKEKSFKDFSEDEQKAVAGIVANIGDGIENWQFFGSTSANGHFKTKLKDKKIVKRLSDAIDLIPLEGNVNKDIYDKYVKTMKNVLGMNDPVTICTRFLALKRPDLFVCMAGRTSKNEGQSTISKLLEMLGEKVKKSTTISLNNYWDKVVENIRNSKWYKETMRVDADIIEKRVYQYRAAMLDGLCYRLNESFN